jgi:hypothetical protein
MNKEPSPICKGLMKLHKQKKEGAATSEPLSKWDEKSHTLEYEGEYPSSDPQEWTPEYVLQFVEKHHAEWNKHLADAINAALAALRAVVKDDCETDTNVRELARPILGDFKVDGDSYGVPGLEDITKELIKQLTAEREESEKVAQRLYGIIKETQQQLLQAQAAIEKHNKSVEDWMELTTCETCLRFRGEFKIKIDATALAEHDAKMMQAVIGELENERKKVKPLVEELERLKPWQSVEDARRIDAALAKVKETPNV